MGKDLKRIWGGSVEDLRFGKMWGRSGEDLEEIWEGSGEDLGDSGEDIRRIRVGSVTGKPPQIYIYNSRSTAAGGRYVIERDFQFIRADLTYRVGLYI